MELGTAGFVGVPVFARVFIRMELGTAGFVGVPVFARVFIRMELVTAGFVGVPVFARVFIRMHNVCEEETLSVKHLKMTEKFLSAVCSFVETCKCLKTYNEFSAVSPNSRFFQDSTPVFEQIWNLVTVYLRQAVVLHRPLPKGGSNRAIYVYK
jgi:hypothetical protein